MFKKWILLFSIVACALTVSCTTPDRGGNSQSEGSVSVESSAEQSNTYKITFKQAGASDVVKTVNKGETLTDIPTPKTKTGYTVKWEVADFSIIMSDTTVNAVETPNTYVVTYDANGGTVSSATQNVVFDEETMLLTPERDGYFFLGWMYENSAVVSPNKWTIADDVTLIANWQDNRPSYTVTFVDGTRAKEISVKKGESVNAADIPAFVGKVGYTPSWDKTDLTNITSNTTVTAVYTANEYTITYSADGFAIDGTTLKLTYGEVCSALDMSLTKADYNFLGWKYGEVTYTNASVWDVDKDVTLTEDWAAKDKAVVTFTDTSGATIFRTVNVGETLTDIPSPSTKTGYTVDMENWYFDKACTQIAAFKNVEGAFTVYAKATPNTYTVTYDANGGTLANPSQQVIFDAEYTLATPTHEKSYMRFDGWAVADGDIVTSNGVWTTDGSVQLTAKWTDTRETFTVSFVQEGQPIKAFFVKKGDAFTDIPDVAKKKGYNVSWDETALSKLGAVTENVEVVAKETAKTFKLTFDATEGTMQTTSIMVTYGKEYSLENPTHDEYTFVYWMCNDERVSSSGVWDIDADGGEIELVAKWRKSQWTDFH